MAPRECLVVVDVYRMLVGADLVIVLMKPQVGLGRRYGLRARASGKATQRGGKLVFSKRLGQPRYAGVDRGVLSVA